MQRDVHIVPLSWSSNNVPEEPGFLKIANRGGKHEKNT